MKRLFLKEKTIGFYISLVAAVASLVTDIVYIVTDMGDRTFSMAVFILSLFAAVLITVNVLWRNPLGLLPSAICAAAAVGIQIYVSIPTITDIFNKVNFYGGNHMAAVVFPVLHLVIAILFVIACFMKNRKDLSESNCNDLLEC